MTISKVLQASFAEKQEAKLPVFGGDHQRILLRINESGASPAIANDGICTDIWDPTGYDM